MKLSEFTKKYIEKFGDKEIDEVELSKRLVEEKYFVPKLGEEYWYVTADGSPTFSEWKGSYVDEWIFKYQQVFRTKEEAENKAQSQANLLKIERDFLDNSEEIDWEDKNQAKYTIAINDGVAVIARTQGLNGGGIYTTNLEWLEDYYDENKEIILKYYFQVK